MPVGHWTSDVLRSVNTVQHNHVARVFFFFVLLSLEEVEDEMILCSLSLQARRTCKHALSGELRKLVRPSERTPGQAILRGCAGVSIYSGVLMFETGSRAISLN